MIVIFLLLGLLNARASPLAGSPALASENARKTCCYPDKYAWKTAAKTVVRRIAEDDNGVQLLPDQTFVTESHIAKDGLNYVESTFQNYIPATLVVKSAKAVVSYTWHSDEGCYETAKKTRNFNTQASCYGTYIGSSEMDGQQVSVYQDVFVARHRNTTLTIYAVDDDEGSCTPKLTSFVDFRPNRIRNVTTKFTIVDFGEEHEEILQMSVMKCAGRQ